VAEVIRAEAVKDVAVGLGRLLRAVRPWQPAVARTIRRYGLTLAALVEIAAHHRPDAVAIVDDNGALTNAELLRGAEELADRLVGKGNRVGVLAGNSRDFVVAVAAAGRVGADVTLLDPAMAPTELEDFVESERLDLLLVDTPDRLESLDLAAARELVATTSSHLVGRAMTSRKASPAGGRLVVPTSGTTGPAKGAHRTFRLAHAIPISTLVREIPMRQGQTMLLTPPLCRGFGLGFLALGLTFGLRVLLCRRSENQSELLREFRPDLLVGVPPVLARLASIVGKHRVATVVSGAMPLEPAVAAELRTAFGSALFNLYGATEQGWSTLATPEDLGAAPGTIGRPAAGVRLHVLDADARPVPPGVVGHLWVESALAFSHYSNGSDRPRLGRLIASGDLAHSDEQGRYFLHGRLS
jgi:fatty-acyl-CoA synthase